MKTYRTKLLLILLITQIGHLTAQETRRQVLNDLIGEALINNPEIAAHRERIDAANARVKRVSTLPDPQIRLGIVNLPINSFTFNQEPMSGKQIMLTQRIPFPGLLGEREKQSRQEKEILEARLRIKENEIIRSIKELVFEIGFIQESLTISSKNRSLLAQYEIMARKKYEVGQGKQYDVLKAQVTLAKFDEKIIHYKQKLRTLKVKLNTLLGKHVFTDIDELPENSLSTSEHNSTYFIEMAQENNPRVKLQMALIDKSISMRGFSQKGYVPNFDISFAYTQRDDILGRKMYDFFSAHVGFSLPLYFWRKQNLMIKETDHTLQQRYLELKAIKNELMNKIAQLTIKIEETEELISLYKGSILPQNEQSLQVSLAEYKVNEIDFLTLLDTQKRIYDDELYYHRLIADHEILIAQINEAAGINVF